ncbi:MAG TPA: protein phosphatase 2C domain-containing protein, partial [Vicinamibacterales bacterium]
MNVLRASWLAAAYRSDAGRVRGNNEDLAVCDPDAGVLGVIDGVGGQTAGEVAAAIADRVIRERLSRPLGSPADRVREAIALANNEIWKLSEERPEYDGMTCVVTLAILNDARRVTIGHVGDSRCYKMTATGLRKLTHDHSPVGEREDAGELTEAQAMRHPRRNEVFRDVGSEYRDKDDGEFIEIVEETLESDAAILLSTDGLTDMIDSSAIERVVRTHAGDPQAVADALVCEANSAGGKDNVTVVYAEAPGFATAVRGAPPTTSTPARRRGNPIVRGLRWMLRQYATWLAAGILIGVAGALALIARLGGGVPAEKRHTLIVGENAPFARIAAALAAARPGDVVQVEPGTYAERVSVPDGVDLVARVPGSVALRRLDTAEGEWIAVTANGPGTISGIRF